MGRPCMKVEDEDLGVWNGKDISAMLRTGDMGVMSYAASDAGGGRTRYE